MMEFLSEQNDLLLLRKTENPQSKHSQLTFDFIRIMEIVSERQNHITLYLSTFKTYKNIVDYCQKRRKCAAHLFLSFCVVPLAAVLLFIPFPNNFVSRYITSLEAS